MAEVKHARRNAGTDQDVVDRAKDFWTRYGRGLMIAAGAVILIGGGWLAYKYLVKAPKEEKAAEAIWKAETYFMEDSIQKALKGDGQFAGLEKIADQYDGTAAGNLADFYAGALSLKAGEFQKAVNHLKDFSTDSKPVQARAYKLLGDAYAGINKNAEALSNYKKAAKEFTKDRLNTSEYLFFAAYFADRVLNDKKEATELYKELATDYPETPRAIEAEKYLAYLGVYKTNE
jgi:predicted negative regulator of RcsB-dependent stress response